MATQLLFQQTEREARDHTVWPLDAWRLNLALRFVPVSTCLNDQRSAYDFDTRGSFRMVNLNAQLSRGMHGVHSSGQSEPDGFLG